MTEHAKEKRCAYEESIAVKGRGRLDLVPKEDRRRRQRETKRFCLLPNPPYEFELGFFYDPNSNDFALHVIPLGEKGDQFLKDHVILPLQKTLDLKDTESLRKSVEKSCVVCGNATKRLKDIVDKHFRVETTKVIDNRAPGNMEASDDGMDPNFESTSDQATLKIHPGSNSDQATGPQEQLDDHAGSNDRALVSEIGRNSDQVTSPQEQLDDHAGSNDRALVSETDFVKDMSQLPDVPTEDIWTDDDGVPIQDDDNDDQASQEVPAASTTTRNRESPAASTTTRNRESLTFSTDAVSKVSTTMAPVLLTTDDQDDMMGADDHDGPGQELLNQMDDTESTNHREHTHQEPNPAEAKLLADTQRANLLKGELGQTKALLMESKSKIESLEELLAATKRENLLQRELDKIRKQEEQKAAEEKLLAATQRANLLQRELDKIRKQEEPKAAEEKLLAATQRANLLEEELERTKQEAHQEQKAAEEKLFAINR